MVEIPKEHDFLTWSIQNFVRKVEQFVRNTILFDELTWLKSYTTQENTWLRFMPFFIKNCLVLLRNFVIKLVQ